MAVDEPVTLAEVARQVQHLGEDLREDLREIKDKMVTREVYEAQRETARTETDSLKLRLAALESRGRWVVAGILIPIVVVVLNAVLSAKGVKP